VDDDQCLQHRHSNVIRELDRRGAGPSLSAVNTDEVREQSGLMHGAADAQELERLSDAEFEAHRLAAGQFAQLGDVLEQTGRCREGLVAGWRLAFDAQRNSAGRRDLGGHLVRGENPPVTRLRPLRELQLDHLDVGNAGHLPEGIRIEATVKTGGQTGVEMEALTAVSTACLTVYDMVKAVEKGMVIEDIRLVLKEGGKSGRYEAPK